MNIRRRKFITSVGAGLAAVGGARVFGVDKPAGPRRLVLNPYADADWSSLQKGNFHTHTTVSDGRLQPHETVDAYHRLGYSVLALTDHDAVSYPWTGFQGVEKSWSLYKDRMTDVENRDPQALGMVAVEANEITSRIHHHLSLFSDYNREPDDRKDLPGDLAAIRAYSGRAVAVIAHPAYHWSKKYGGKSGFVIHMPNPLRELPVGDFTIETWFCTKETGRAILLGNYASANVPALNLELHNDNCVRVFVMPPQGRPTISLNVPASDFDINTRDNKWHHLAGVRRDGKIRLYLDGKLVGERNDTAKAYVLGGESFYLGRDARDNAFFGRGGLMDDVRLWSRGLSGEEIAGIVSGTRPSAEGLVAQYDFDSGDGVTVEDTANHPAGPFPAKTVNGKPACYNTSVPEPLRTGSVRSIALGPVALPTSVEPAAFAEYLGLYRKFSSEFLVGMEVFNGSRPMPEYHLDRQLWDQLLSELMPHRPVWGFSNDDAHSISMVGRDWNTFPLSTPMLRNVRQAMISGNFYFSSIRPVGDAGDADGTPRIETVEHDPSAGTLKVHATVAGQPVDGQFVRWIANGEAVACGAVLDYHRTPGICNYVRAEIIGPGGITCTNPFGFQ